MGRRLLFVSPSAYPLGGLATWLDFVVPGLRERGWEVLVGLASGTHHDVAAYCRDHRGLPVLEIACRTGTREGRVRAMAAALREARADLVAGVNIPDAYAAVERLRLAGEAAPRAVMTIHGIEPDLYEDLREFREVLDGVICTNRLACRLAVAEGGAEVSRVRYAPYGVEIPEVPRGARPRRDVLEVAFVGRLEESQKRLGDLARIAELLDERAVPARLTIVGGGPDERGLRERLAPLAARGRVRFTGRLGAERVLAEVYPHCDVLLLTSSWETGPIVAWEAMARGVCVAGSRYVGSGLEGALADGENCLLFAVGDVPAAAAAVAALADDGLRNRIAGGGLELVRRRYSIAASVAAWHEALAAVAGGPPAGTRTAPAALEPSGRLDRVLGRGLAEDVRELLGRRPRPAGGAGDEWPHSYGRRRSDDPAFQRIAAALDAGRGSGA